MKYVIYSSKYKEFKSAGTIRYQKNKVIFDMSKDLKENLLSIKYLGKTFNITEGIRYLKALTLKYHSASYIIFEFEPEDITWIPEDYISMDNIQKQFELLTLWRKEIL
jgi:hypothetical protein